ncbi:hypothetical protein GGQ62_001220 [Polymorphobacter fuscus]|uniref:PEPxxWA-CTERM sorting domain-containing protein n=1 Tax=Sandarakinorhabdus fusca TaxID=1439888 RepID=A0A7C9KN57_9SPHN|nr:NF038122 family metalloprotease [Polymorphobacter fuscus]KAB7644403.1 PEP-CTERM sorting domain-containing protein [Polymorphobacter fuscus]MQT18323.1 PEPxxWA-CTERM sorting domain-containing protein [Polymorphobacter fuscus]NJC08222.1 hypothetical protein [Polymorphobacter fuscus]
MRAALLAAVATTPAFGQALGHVHTAVCNHQWEDNQGAYDAGGLTFTTGSTAGGGGLTFVLNDLGGVGIGTDARAGFEAAGALFSGLFRDNITIRLDVRFSALGPGILGSTGSTTNTVGYNNVQTALVSDSKTFFDNIAVGTLGAAPISFVTNEPPAAGAIDSRLRFFDNNNTFDNNNLNVNTAQMKAMGLTPTYAANNPGQRDGSVSFSSAFTWDFDPTDGITPGSFDFVGVAAHEIGHALGFRSGVDLADVNALPGVALPGARGLNNIAWGTVHDLFRYGDFEGDFVRDWSIGGGPCYTINGTSCLAPLSTGRLNGDLRQASHWKDDQLLNIAPPLGLMDPTATGPNGTRPLQLFTKFDLIAFDAMGYDLASAVPEPQNWAMLIAGFGLIGALARRERRSVTV